MQIRKIKGDEKQVEAVMIDLFDRAHDSIEWSDGLYTDFYKTHPNLQASIQRAAERVPSFCLLIDSPVDVEQKKQELPWLFKLVSDNLIVARKSGYEIPHWLIVDNRDFRLEDKHPLDQPGLNNILIKDADDSIKDITSDIISTFQEEWDSANPIH
jgi:hypothetical protein